MEGLSSKEAHRRLKIYGRNEIKRVKRVSPLKIFISQFISPLILLLIAAATISFFINYLQAENFFDSLLILLIVFVAALAGFAQEYKAERAVEALMKLAAPKAKVIRDGKEQEILASEVVPGDLTVVESGDIIPADAEILEGELQVNEAPLTGESKAVRKGVGDKIFSHCGTFIGRAIARVVATGMKTEIGKIATKMQEIAEVKTPFQLQMEKFSKKLVLLTSAIIIVTFAIGFGKFGMISAFLLAVSLAVAAIPEGLPAVITTSLSLGGREMARKNALVRKLAVTESIGSCDVICCDKTGTITEGKMTVKEIWFLEKSKQAERLALECCHYCNDAEKIFKEGKEELVGDETDIALKEFSEEKVKEEGERVEEIPFSSERKMMTVAHRFKHETLVFSKGAPEVILERCEKIMIGNRFSKLSLKLKERVKKENSKFASRGYRVIGLAYKKYKKPLEKNLVFLGLAVLSDPPRAEAKEALTECHSAGIRVIMLTGDNPETAKAVAQEIGLKSKGAISGDELDRMGDKELDEALRKGVNIFARISPFHKLRILKILQGRGHVVAMTGDGVNDALALKRADVGIAMGIKGTEVAKEASDMVLLDDNFATIRTAVKEGRRIFDNIRKFVNYLLSCNVAEVLVIFFATLFFPFMVLFPVQILWINLITDGLPALALSVDPARHDVMRRKPKKREEGIIDKRLMMIIGGIGVQMALIILGIFLVTQWLGIERARSALFTGFIMYELARIGMIRYSEKLASLKDWLANKFLIISIALSLLLQLLLLYSPLSTYFKVTGLGIFEWVVLIGAVIGGFLLGIGTTKVIDRFVK